MDFKKLDDFLFTKNIYEIKQYETQNNFNDFPELTTFDTLYDPAVGYHRLPKEVFFKNKQFYINKHNRFSEMHNHIHDFIEINYVYSGTCTQTIKNKTLPLSAGTICVLDRDVPHAIKELDENDILINILINEETFSSLFLFQLEKEKSLLGNFLSQAFKEDAKHDNYMLFDTHKAPQIHHQIQLMLMEYWFNEDSDPNIIEQYVQLIITELMRIYKEATESIYETDGINHLEILTFIDKNYSHLMLKDVEEAFNYNGNYISNTLKKTTGKNFQETLLEKRLLIAMDLITHTTISIADIVEETGFKSISYFYRQFKKRFGQTPKSFRTSIK